MNLNQIAWPIFRLGEHQPQQTDGLVYYSKEYVDKDSQESKIGLRIIDDKNLPGANLGRRRLQLKASGESLFPISRAVYFIADLVKLAKPTTWFIDSHGMVFNYKKTTRAKLTFHKIKQVLPGTQTGAVVELEGVSQRFKCIYRPSESQQWAGVLHWNLGLLLYGFYESEPKTSWRNV